MTSTPPADTGCQELVSWNLKSSSPIHAVILVGFILYESYFLLPMFLMPSMHLPWYKYGGLRTTCWNQFSPSAVWVGDGMGSNSGRQDRWQACLPTEPSCQSNLSSGQLQTHDLPVSACSTYPTSMCHNSWLCKSCIDNHGCCEFPKQQPFPKHLYHSTPFHSGSYLFTAIFHEPWGPWHRCHIYGQALNSHLFLSFWPVVSLCIDH